MPNIIKFVGLDQGIKNAGKKSGFVRRILTGLFTASGKTRAWVKTHPYSATGIGAGVVGAGYGTRSYVKQHAESKNSSWTDVTPFDPVDPDAYDASIDPMAVIDSKIEENNKIVEDNQAKMDAMVEGKTTEEQQAIIESTEYQSLRRDQESATLAIKELKSLKNCLSELATMCLSDETSVYNDLSNGYYDDIRSLTEHKKARAAAQIRSIHGEDPISIYQLMHTLGGCLGQQLAADSRLDVALSAFLIGYYMSGTTITTSDSGIREILIKLNHDILRGADPFGNAAAQPSSVQDVLKFVSSASLERGVLWRAL